MSPITTHVLDTAHGRPAEGMAVVLERRAEGRWAKLGSSTTDADGRVTNLLPEQHVLESGIYQLCFATGDYFRSLGVKGFYPEVRVLVQIEAGGHYHIPLLLSPFGYSTYRGS